MVAQAQEYYKSKANNYKLFLCPGGVHQSIIDFVGKEKTVLDVGCATGYLGAELKKNNNKVFGIEISDVAAQSAKKVLDHVIIGNIEDIVLPYSEKQFDVIVCADVLEHLFQPIKILKKLHKYIKDDGLLIVSLPNIAHWSIRFKLLLGRFNYEESGLLDDGHIRFFTFNSAVRMIISAGYKIEKYDVFISLPKGLNKLVYYLKMDKIFKRFFKEMFGNQFLFLLKKDN